MTRERFFRIPLQAVYILMGLAVLAGGGTAAYELILNKNKTVPSGLESVVTGPTPVTNATPVTTAAPTATVMPGLENILTDAQVVEYVNELYVNELKGPQLITPEMLNKIDTAYKSLHFQLTGQTFESSRFEIKLMTREEFDKSVPDYLKGSEGTIDLSNYAYVDRDGKVNIYGKIYVKAVSHVGEEGNLLNILMVLAAETGQAEQARLFWEHLAENGGNGLEIDDYTTFYKDVAEKYGLGDISDLLPKPKQFGSISDIMGESNEALYKAAAFHKLEEMGALTLASPYYDEQIVSELVDGLVTFNDFRLRASTISWYKALNDPNARLSLQKTGRITSQQALNLFNESVENTFTIENYEKEVADIIKVIRTAQEYAQPIKDAAKLSQRTGLALLFP